MLRRLEKAIDSIARPAAPGVGVGPPFAPAPEPMEAPPEIVTLRNRVAELEARLQALERLLKVENVQPAEEAPLQLQGAK